MKSSDPEGKVVYGLRAGGAKSRALVLERGWVANRSTSTLLENLKRGQTFKAAAVSLIGGQGQALATYNLEGVLIGSLEHETESPIMLERLALRYETVTFSE